MVFILPRGARPLSSLGNFCILKLGSLPRYPISARAKVIFCRITVPLTTVVRSHGSAAAAIVYNLLRPIGALFTAPSGQALFTESL